jgi:hypothetical protein
MCDVRFRGQSGKHMLALSLSGFDPQRTSARSMDGLIFLDGEPKQFFGA